MAKPIWKEGRVSEPLQMGMFPGILASSRNEQSVRLRAQIAILITDKYTGEKFQRVIPLETDEPEHIVDWLSQALTHARTESDVRSFLDKREGK